jgi:hypothetical protein
MFREPPESKILMTVIQGVHETIDRMWSLRETGVIDWEILTGQKAIAGPDAAQEKGNENRADSRIAITRECSFGTRSSSDSDLDIAGR